MVSPVLAGVGRLICRQRRAQGGRLGRARPGLGAGGRPLWNRAQPVVFCYAGTADPACCQMGAVTRVSPWHWLGGVLLCFAGRAGLAMAGWMGCRLVGLCLLGSPQPFKGSGDVTSVINPDPDSLAPVGEQGDVSSPNHQVTQESDWTVFETENRWTGSNYFARHGPEASAE